MTLESVETYISVQTLQTLQMHRKTSVPPNVCIFLHMQITGKLLENCKTLQELGDLSWSLPESSDRADGDPMSLKAYNPSTESRRKV